MKICGLLLCCLLPMMVQAQTTETNPQAVVDLCERVCGPGAAAHFIFEVDGAKDGCARHFTIAPADGKIRIAAGDNSSLCCGLNWYLNHVARVNISWNNLRQQVTDFPMPANEEAHTTYATWSYYLNYCTFSYSMAVWDEERWMKEVDWMALHGVNLPLQAVGIDAVWYRMLTNEFGFTHSEASEFIAGPAFQGWWLMNNLIGHGGPNPEWWYERQADLGRKITDRMRGLGMSPCLPGFVGMAPQKYVNQTGVQSYSGSWCGFTSPLLIAPGDAFDRMAEQYYKYINNVFGFLPESYSMDPVHERGLPGGMGQAGYKSLCDAARNAMNKWGAASADKAPLWVAQEWQVNADQHRIDALGDNNTLLLDLSSERLTYKNRYGNKDYLFCMLHNYGGNIGMYGCVEMMLKNYKEHLKTGHPDRMATGASTSTAGFLCGVGATPEGIETNPMLYDLLFELPWMSAVPEATAWLNEYTVCRYGVEDAQVQLAWQKMLETVYANTSTGQQGCREPVFCARPNLSGNGASSWAGASYHWDKQKVIDAANLLIEGGRRNGLKGANYEYDVADFARQALTDYAHTLQMEMAGLDPKSERFADCADAFLALMDDIDNLLGTVEDFRLGRWTGMARKVATEAGHAADADWMEKNARMLITTWGDSYAATNNGGLRDYGNREWQGLITGYYKPRWVAYFNDLKAKGSCAITANNWLDNYERPFVYGRTVAYGSYPGGAATGNTVEVAKSLLNKYFGTGDALSFTYQGWNFTCTNVGLNLTLTDVAGGSGAVSIPEKITIDGTLYRIVALAPDFMKGNADVTAINLPASLTDIGGSLALPAGSSVETIGGSYPSAKHHWTLRKPLSCTGKWSINVVMRIGTQNFNQWGAVCFAPHTATADPTAGYTGFQFYQNASTNSSGDLHIMPERSGVRYVTDTKTKKHINLLGKTVCTRLAFNNGKWEFTLLSDAGDNGKVTYTSKITSDITAVNAWVGDDSEILSVTYEDGNDAAVVLFDCPNLEAVNVDAANAMLRSIDGVLWDKKATALLRLPAARAAHAATDAATVVTVDAAFSGTGAMVDCRPAQAAMSTCLPSGRTCLRLSSATDELTALKRIPTSTAFGLVRIDRELNVGGFDDVTLPFTLTADEVEATFKGIYTPYDYGYDASLGEDPVMLVKPADAFAACTPYVVEAREGASLAFANKKLSTSLKTVSFRLCGEDAKGKFCGTLSPRDIAVGATCAVMRDGQGFAPVSEPVRLAAYRTYVEAASGLADCRIVVGDGTMLNDAVAAAVADRSGGQAYDLQGRPVATPAHGLFIVNNKKVVR